MHVNFNRQTHYEHRTCADVMTSDILPIPQSMISDNNIIAQNLMFPANKSRMTRNELTN
jgi:hypothetical protein